MNYIYEDKLQEISNCPPNDYKLLDNYKSYRFTYDTIDHCDNFKSPADKTPSILHQKSDFKKCESYALSFVDSLENALEFYEYLESFIKNIDTKIGTHIAEGIIYKSDGLASDCDNSGHFNFHPSKGNNLIHNFTVLNNIQKLKNERN